MKTNNFASEPIASHVIDGSFRRGSMRNLFRRSHIDNFQFLSEIENATGAPDGGILTYRECWIPAVFRHSSEMRAKNNQQSGFRSSRRGASSRNSKVHIRLKSRSSDVRWRHPQARACWPTNGTRSSGFAEVSDIFSSRYNSL